MNLKPTEPIAGSAVPPQGPSAKRMPEEKSFTTHDGVELFYRYWPALTPTPKGAILLFHRGHEHSGRMAHLVDELDLPDFAFFAWDARGHGRSPGERGYQPEHRHLGARRAELRAIISPRAIGIRTEDMAVIAQSVGAVLIAAWAHDYAPKIRAHGARLAGLLGEALRAVRAAPRSS